MKSHMGKWWDREELNSIAKEFGWKLSFIEQPNELVFIL